MVIKEYSDGSEFTGTHLVAALAGAVVGSAALFALSEWRTNRFVRKHNKKTGKS